jgi:signal transduction histidine kinase
MGEDESGREASHELHEDSERLLRAVDELRALEREKRRQKLSGRPFRELAERVEAKAREVFRIAGEETDDARAASRLEESDPATAASTIEELHEVENGR